MANRSYDTDYNEKTGDLLIFIVKRRVFPFASGILGDAEPTNLAGTTKPADDGQTGAQARIERWTNY